MISTRFYPQLEDKLRQNKDLYNSKTLRQTYQSAVKMAATAPKMMDGYTVHDVDGVSRVSLSLTKATECWLTVVRTYGATWSEGGPSVWSKDNMVKKDPCKCKQLCNAIRKRIPRHRIIFSTNSFEEGDKGAHDLCGEIRRKMVGGPVIDKWVKIWFPLLGKIDFNVQEGERLNLGIRLANNPLKVHVGWKGNQLMDATITEAWVGPREVFGELWMKNTIMTYIDTGKEPEDSESQTLLTPTKKFWFKEGESVLKVSKHSRWKETESSQAYFKPRYNVKPKNNSGVFRNMVFKTYL